MRFLLLILMIALLPLRSWALVGEPPSPHPTTFVAIEETASEHPCHSSLSSTSENAAQTSQAKHPAQQTTCSTCGDCALCHTLATTSTPLLPAPPLLSHWLRPNSGDRFDSALAALSLKPPIP
jgi:cytochrome c553